MHSGITINIITLCHILLLLNIFNLCWQYQILLLNEKASQQADCDKAKVKITRYGEFPKSIESHTEIGIIQNTNKAEWLLCNGQTLLAAERDRIESAK